MDQGSPEIVQLNRAMACIEAHIDDNLALADVSAVTGYSPYHFGRLFYYIADMPLSEYIRRRKLSLAAMVLKNNGAKVIDLAVLYGYDSADSFTHAFVKQHGVTPTAARRQGVSLTIFPPITFQINIKGVQAMNWRIEEKDAFEVVGISRFFKNDESGKIPAWWDETYTDRSRIKLTEQLGYDDLIGVCYHTDEKADGFRYMIGLFVRESADTSGFETIKIPKTTWAIFRSGEVAHNPTGAEIPKLFQRAYTEWLPSSGYDKAPGPDMEIYGITDGGADGFVNFYEEVWLPVIKK